MVAEVGHSGVEMGNLVAKGVVGLFEVGALGLASSKQVLEVGALSSAGIELVS